MDFTSIEQPTLAVELKERLEGLLIAVTVDRAVDRLA